MSRTITAGWESDVMQPLNESYKHRHASTTTNIKNNNRYNLISFYYYIYYKSIKCTKQRQKKNMVKLSFKCSVTSLFLTYPSLKVLGFSQVLGDGIGWAGLHRKIVKLNKKIAVEWCVKTIKVQNVWQKTHISAPPFFPTEACFFSFPAK